jgi:hypothetical protein
LTASILFFLWISGADAKPHPASPEDEAAVAQAIKEAKAIADIDLVDAQKRIIALEQKMGRRDEQGKLAFNAPPIRKYLPSQKPEVLYAYGRAVEDAGRARREVSAKMKVAIDLALDAYGIADSQRRPTGAILSGPPNQPNEPGALRSYLRQTATFEPELTFSLLDESGTLGHTTHDGKVRIEWGAFDYPGKLGMTLYHESLHFQDLLTPDVEILDEPRNEIRQRRGEHGLWYRVFKLKYADARQRDEVRLKYARKIPEWDRMVREGFNPTTEQGSLALKAMLNTAIRPNGDHSLPPWIKPGLDDILGEADELAAAVSAETRERRAREAAAELERRERERLEDGRRLFASLEAFSRRFCEAAVAGAVPESMNMDFLEWRNGNYLAFSTEQPMIDLGELGFSAECTKFFENQILVARRKRYNHSIVTFEWAAQVVKEAYRRSHPVIPTLPSSRPVPPRVLEPVVPDGSVPPDADIPEPPSVPHCRYHAWCRAKTEPRDN